MRVTRASSLPPFEAPEAREGVDVAGSLKAPGVTVPSRDGLSNTAGAVAVPICHIENTCNHCPDGSTTPIAEEREIAY